MRLVWFVFLSELFLFYLFKPILPGASYIPILFLSLHLIIVLIVISSYERKIASLLLIALAARVSFMFWDIYARGIYILPHSGSDTEGYLASGLTVAKDLSIVFEDIYGGLYSKILGVLFFLGPEDRIMGHYVNVLLGLTAIMIVVKIFEEWEVRSSVQTVSLWIMALFPSGVIFSSILLREALISTLVILSFYFCLRWYRTSHLEDMSVAIGILLIGATLHSGVIGVVVGYVFLIIFYNHKRKELVFSPRSVIPFSLFSLSLVSLMVLPLQNIPFLGKFAFYMERDRGLYDMASGGEGEGAGGSAYLTGLSIDTPLEVLLYAPVKMFYFVSSPLPWGWRGFSDLASFSYDGVIYMGIVLFLIVKFRDHVKANPLLLATFIMIMATVFIFGIGVDNAGTSMRHRFKVFYLVIVLSGLVMNRLDTAKDPVSKAVSSRGHSSALRG